MPNWSSTEIEFVGERRKIAKIARRFKESGLSQGSLKEPTDDILYDNYTDKDGRIHTGNWHKWRLAKWGTKWNINPKEAFIAYDENSTSREHTLLLEFESAWGGPCHWFSTMCENYKLTGEYFDAESGCDFSRLIKYENGELIEDCSDDYVSEMSFERLGGMEFLLTNYDHLVDNIDYEHWISLVKDNIQTFKLFKSYGSKRPIFDFLKMAFIHIGYGQNKVRDSWKEYKETSWKEVT